MANNKTPDYKQGYKEGFNAGYCKGRSDGSRFDNLKAKWKYVKGQWFCTNCNTKHEQSHDDYCCKCGAKMDVEEAD